MVPTPAFKLALKSSLTTIFAQLCLRTSANVFGRLFGIEFKADDDTFVRPLSLFEFVCCFNLTDDLTYKLSHTSSESFNDAAIPAFTSASILQECHSRLASICDANLQLYEPNITHAPAAMANVFINGTTGSRLPDHPKWISAYDSDPSCRLIKDMITNPSRINNESLQKIHSSFRMPLWESLLVLENDMIVLREPIGDGSSSYCKLRLVPPTATFASISSGQACINLSRPSAPNVLAVPSPTAHTNLRAHWYILSPSLPR